MTTNDEFPGQRVDDPPTHFQKGPSDGEEASDDGSFGVASPNLINVSVCRQSYGYYSVFQFVADLSIELGWHSTTVELYEIVGGARTWIASMTRDLSEPLPPPGTGRRERWSATTFANNSGANRSFEVDAFLYRFQDQTVSKAVTAGPSTPHCPS